MDEYQAYLDTLSDEQRQLIEEKEQMAAEIEAEQSNKPYATTGEATLIGLPGVFTMYEQETYRYCGPACIKSALMYITGTSPTQSQINREINETFTNIPEYVNARQDKCLYVFSKPQTKDDITIRIRSDITVDKVPTFLRIVIPEDIEWFYPPTYHCVLSNGIYDDLETILIADPLGGKVKDCPAFYEKPASTIAKITTSICW